MSTEKLLHEATALATSNQSHDLELLARILSLPEFLAACKEHTRVTARLLRHLAENAEPGARALFSTLTVEPRYLSCDWFMIQVIEASAFFRPATAQLAKFWDNHSRPDDGFTPTTISALADNASSEALKIIEKKFVTDEHDDEMKVAWMRTRILSRRDVLPILEMCAGLLVGPMRTRLKLRLVEVLFDYRPDEWYRPATVVSPPDLEAMSPTVLLRLFSIGETVLKQLPLPRRTRKAVLTSLKDINDLLGARRAMD